MIYDQCKTFCVFFVVGILIGIIFDFFRALRKNFKTNNIIIYIEDILFFIIIGALFLKSVLIFSFGEIRFYIFIAIIFGIITYILTIEKICMIIFETFLYSIKKIILFLITILKIPIKFISNVMLKLKR